jgi:hypothetical protein
MSLCPRAVVCFVKQNKCWMICSVVLGANSSVFSKLDRYERRYPVRTVPAVATIREGHYFSSRVDSLIHND